MSFTQPQALVERARPLVRHLGLGLALGGVAIAAFAHWCWEPLEQLTPFIVSFGVLGGIILLASIRALTRRTSGRLNIDERGISIDDELVVSAANAKSARPTPCEIDKGRRVWMGGDYDFGITLAPDGDVAGLIGALRTTLRARPSFRAIPLDATARRSLAVRAVAITSVVCVLGGGLLSSFGGSFAAGAVLGFFAAIPFSLLALAVTVIAAPVRVTVGSDGIELRHLLRTTKFVSFADITSSALGGTDGSDVVLAMRDGQQIRFGFGLDAKNDDDGPHLQALTAMSVVWSAAELYKASAGGGGNSHALLARNGRTVDDWLRAVRAARAENASFRSMTMQDEELWAIAEDPALPDTLRVGAAVALRELLDDRSRARLRVAAESCMAPKLRVAMEAVANPTRTDRSLADALAALDDAGADADLERREARR